MCVSKHVRVRLCECWQQVPLSCRNLLAKSKEVNGAIWHTEPSVSASLTEEQTEKWLDTALLCTHTQGDHCVERGVLWLFV